MTKNRVSTIMYRIQDQNQEPPGTGNFLLGSGFGRFLIFKKDTEPVSLEKLCFPRSASFKFITYTTVNLLFNINIYIYINSLAEKTN